MFNFVKLVQKIFNFTPPSYLSYKQFELLPIVNIYLDFENKPN